MTVPALRADPDACTRCGAPTRTVELHEPALLRHGGYGATRRTRYVACPTCHLIRLTEVKEIRP